jgi:hypothetical protein
MMRGSKLGIIFGVGALVAVVGLASREAVTSPSATGIDRVAAVRGLAAEAGLPQEWGDFLALVAWRESKGNPNAQNDSESEAAAAEKAYRRNADRYESCGYGEEAYEYSGGWFGMMPANGIAQLREELRCLPPSAVFEPRAALAMAVGFARGLMRWDRFDRAPTWLNLRVMWGAPGKGGDTDYLAAARREFAKDAAAVGLSASWLDRRVSALDIKPSQVLERLDFEESEIA